MSFPIDPIQPIPVQTDAMKEGVDRWDDVRRMAVNVRIKVREAINLIRTQMESDGTIRVPADVTGADIATWRTAITNSTTNLNTIDDALLALETL